MVHARPGEVQKYLLSFQDSSQPVGCLLMTLMFTSVAELVIRLTVKIGIAVLFSSLGEQSFVLALSGWLSVLAFGTVVFAILGRDQFRPGNMTRWDEALWLAGASAVLLGYCQVTGA